MTARANVIRQIERSLGDRNLVYFGTRGDDAEGVADINNLTAAFSIIAQYRQRATVAGIALEQYSRLRVDLDAHDIDDDPFVQPIAALRADLLAALLLPTVVFTYRPSTFLSAACFARLGRSTYLGMFKDHQAAFDHKPWVETEVSGLGLDCVPWRYVADSERDAILPLFRKGSVILRLSRGSGGTGLTRVDDPGALAAAWPKQDEAFVSVAPFIDDVVPVNVGGVVWDDGVTIGYPSVQLIGIQELAARPFGYCGNDFAAAKGFSERLVFRIDEATTKIGRWLGRLGYRGAFGVDFLVRGDSPIFIEVNPRFQGSTHASSRIARLMGESCTMTDHLAALMHHEPEPRRQLWKRIQDSPALSHVVLHESDNRDPAASSHVIALQLSSVAGYMHADVLLPTEIEAETGATIGRFVFGRSVTTTGFDLAQDLRQQVTASLGPAKTWQVSA